MSIRLPFLDSAQNFTLEKYFKPLSPKILIKATYLLGYIVLAGFLQVLQLPPKIKKFFPQLYMPLTPLQTSLNLMHLCNIKIIKDIRQML